MAEWDLFLTINILIILTYMDITEEEKAKIREKVEKLKSSKFKQ